VSVDSPIPGTVLQPGTQWLAATRFLPEPRPAQDDYRMPAPRRTGRLAQMLSALSRP
jgi:hypothetical protein